MSSKELERPEVLDALVGFMCTNTPVKDITEDGYIPTEAEIERFPALRVAFEADRVFLYNIAVPQ